MLGIEPSRVGFVRQREMRATVNAALNQLEHPDIHPHARVDALPIAVYLQDRDDRITFANAACHDLLSADGEALSSQSVSSYYPQEQADEYRKKDQEIFETGLGQDRIEQRRIGPKGREIDVEAIKIPVHDPNGEIVSLQGIFWDATERRKSEETLLRAKDDI